MKLVPLGDRVVLNRVQKKKLPNPESFLQQKHRKDRKMLRLSQSDLVDW